MKNIVLKIKKWERIFSSQLKSKNSRWNTGRLIHQFGSKKAAKILGGKYNLQISDIVFIERLLRRKIVRVV